MHVCVGSSCCRRSKHFWAIAPPDIRPVQTCWSWSSIFKMLIISPSLENYHSMMLKWSFHRTIKSSGWKIYSSLQDDCIALYVTQSFFILETWLLWPWHVKIHANSSNVTQHLITTSCRQFWQPCCWQLNKTKAMLMMQDEKSYVVDARFVQNVT